MTDDTPDTSEASGLQPSRREALGAIAAAGVASLVGTGTASAQVGGGPDGDELAHLLDRMYSGAGDEVPDAGVEGRLFYVTATAGGYDAGELLRDTGTQWVNPELTTGPIDSPSVTTEDGVIGSLESGPGSLSDALLYYPGDVSGGGVVRDYSNNQNDGVYGLHSRWIQYVKPRAVHYNGNEDKTYTGYIGGSGSAGDDPLNEIIASYDHNTGELTRTTLAEGVSSDDHANPSILVRSDGHIVCFWTDHNGDTLYWTISSNPEDISSFGTVNSITMASVTYTQPFQFSDDTIRILYRNRAGTGDGHWYYRDSTDSGSTFGGQTRLFSAPSGHYSVYPVTAQESNGDIHYFVTDAEGTQDDPKNDVRYVKYDRSADEYVDSSGTSISTTSNLPLSFSSLELVYDSSASGNHDAWVWDAGVDENGNPGVVFSTYPTSTNHEYRWAFNDGSWHQSKLIDAGSHIAKQVPELYYSGGAAMPRDDPTTVYAAVERGDNSDLRKYTTDNQGRTFSQSYVVSDPAQYHIRPTVPENAHSEIPALWLNGSYYRLNKSLTTLRGLPSQDTDGPTMMDGDGGYGVCLGDNLYDPHVFEDGISLSCQFSTRDINKTQFLLNFEGAVKLAIGQQTTGELEFGLYDGSSVITASWDGLSTNTEYVVEGKWDGKDTMRLLVDGDEKATATFNGPVSLGELDRPWTLMTNRAFNWGSLDGSLRHVRTLPRGTTTEESQRIVKISK